MTWRCDSAAISFRKDKTMCCWWRPEFAAQHGGSCIKDPYEPDTVFQLDRFHIRQEIKRKLNRDRKAMKAVEELFKAEKMDEMLEYIRIYAGSVETDDEKDTCSKKAREPYRYLNNNRDGPMPY